MAYLTLFTIPKGFVDPHVSLIQRNALASWQALGSEVEVLVMGDDPGVAEAAAEHGATHLGDPAKNEFGTPLLDWAFAEAAARGSGEVLCYTNADIILLPDLLATARALRFPDYLAIGQRWDCDITEPIDFAERAATLRAWAHAHGKLDLGRGSDYFLFPRSTAFDMPAFAVGRPGWDNWIMGRALELGMPLVDATEGITAIHQNHDYGHVSQRTGSDWEGPEADRNRRLGGWLERYLHTPANATHVLSDGRPRPARSLRHLRARAEAFFALAPSARPLRALVRAFRSAQRALRPRTAGSGI